MTRTTSSATAATTRPDAKAIHACLTNLGHSKLRDIVSNALIAIKLQLSSGSRRSVYCGFNADGHLIGVHTSRRATYPHEQGEAKELNAPVYGFGVLHEGVKRPRLRAFAWGPGWQFLFLGVVDNGALVIQRSVTTYLDTGTVKYAALHDFPTSVRH